MIIKRHPLIGALAGALLFSAFSAGPALAQTKTIKVAFIDPLSGSFAPLGTLEAQMMEFMTKRINHSGDLKGYKLQLVPFDDKLDPKTAQVDAQKAADKGIHYIIQGDGSNVAFALDHWVKKHNRNNPNDKMLYFNYAAVDPGLSNSNCGFYQFNFDANVNMKMAGLVDYLRKHKNVHKVWLQNMDYSYGHAVAQAAKTMLHKVRPDIKIVGDKFTPIGKTKDYTPYIHQIKKSGAQVVITGNWGADMTLLIKAAGRVGLKNVHFLTFYAGTQNAVNAMGSAGAGRVVQISPWAAGVHNQKMTKLAAEFKKKYHKNYYYGSANYVTGMFVKAINQAGSDEPTKVALALEGMHYKTPLGDVYMRNDNHAAVMPMYISTLEKGVKPPLKGTHMNFKVNKRINAVNMFLPTSCHMKDRPKGTATPNAYYNITGK